MKLMDDFLIDAIREINQVEGLAPLTENVAYWNHRGIYTPKQLFWAYDSQIVSDLYKDRHGFRPDLSNWTQADMVDYIEECV